MLLGGLDAERNFQSANWARPDKVVAISVKAFRFVLFDPTRPRVMR